MQHVFLVCSSIYASVHAILHHNKWCTMNTSVVIMLDQYTSSTACPLLPTCQISSMVIRAIGMRTIITTGRILTRFCVFWDLNFSFLQRLFSATVLVNGAAVKFWFYSDITVAKTISTHVKFAWWSPFVGFNLL